MDLILLQLGSPDFAAINMDGTGIGSLIGGAAVTGDNWAGIINPVTGGAVFDPYQCIELVSVSHGIKQQVTTDVSNNARTSGRPVITDFTCVKYVDYTSPKLYDYCLRAKPLDSGAGSPTVIWMLRNSGDQLNTIMRIEMSLTLISEIHFQSHPNDMPTEQFKLNFTEVGWYHQVQGAGVGNAGFTAAAWSIAQNCPIPQLSMKIM